MAKRSVSTTDVQLTPVEKQPERVLVINERCWKDRAITQAAIRAAGEPPKCPASTEKALYCITLVNDTGEAVETAERNWQAWTLVFKSYQVWKLEGIDFSRQRMRLRQGARARPAGLRWVVVELGRTYLGRRVKDILPELDRQKVMGLGPELLAVAAMHPKWAMSIRKEGKTPFVDVPDLEIAPSSAGDFHYSMFLGVQEGQLLLGYDSVDQPRSYSGSGFILPG